MVQEMRESARSKNLADRERNPFHLITEIYVYEWLVATHPRVTRKPLGNDSYRRFLLVKVAVTATEPRVLKMSKL